MKNKTKYEKITEWKKKPKYDGIIGGIVLVSAAMFIFCLLFIKDSSTTILIIVNTSLFIFGSRLLYKSMGADGKTYYTKIKSRRYRK